MVGVAAGIEGAQLASIGPGAVLAWLASVAAIASGALLLIGFLTPATGAMAGLSTVVIATLLAPVPPSGLLLDHVALLFVISDAAAIVLLGPGAFSLDARLFGRREIVIPHEPHSQKS